MPFLPPSASRRRARPAGGLRVRPRGAALVLLAGLAATPAAAQTPDSIRGDSVARPDFELRGLTVSVGRPSSTTGGASAVELTLDSMAHPPAPTLEQILRAMPLVQIRQNSRGEAQPALRGAEDRQIAILVDGVPLTLGWDHRTDLSVVPLTAARGVTLVRGLSSVLHGPNVLGGVVEIAVASGEERQARPAPLVLEAGLDHTGGRQAGASGGALVESGSGEWVLRGGVGYQERPGVTLPGGLGAADGQQPRFLTDGGDLRLNSDVERFDGFVSARFRHDGGAWLSFSSSGYDTERGVPPEAHVDDPRLWRYPSQTRAIAALSGGTGDRDTGRGVGDVEASFGLDAGETSIDAFATEAFRDVVGGEDADDLTLTARLLGDHTLGGSAQLRAAATWADVRHEEVVDDGAPASYRQRLWSVGSEVEWILGASRGTRLTVGAALDGADTPESADKPPLERLWDWGARIGASSLVADGRVLLHGGASRRTRFPALRELYSGALGRFEPNPDLRPEALVGGEAGFTWQGPRGELQVVGFHQRLQDGIVRTSVDTPEGPKFQRVNRDEIRSTGLELLASGELGRVSLAGDVTLQRVRGFTDAGGEVELEYEPAVAGKLAAGVTLPAEVLASADVRYRSDQLCQNPEAGGLEPFETDPELGLGLRRVFTLGSRRGVLSRLDASASVSNLTDAAVFDQCGLPQPGRTFRVQVRLW